MRTFIHTYKVLRTIGEYLPIFTPRLVFFFANWYEYDARLRDTRPSLFRRWYGMVSIHLIVSFFGD